MEANNDPQGYQANPPSFEEVIKKMAAGVGIHFIDLGPSPMPEACCSENSYDPSNPAGLKNTHYLNYVKYLRHTINNLQDVFPNATDQEILVMAQDVLYGFTEEYGTGFGAAA